MSNKEKINFLQHQIEDFKKEIEILKNEQRGLSNNINSLANCVGRNIHKIYNDRKKNSYDSKNIHRKRSR